MHVQVLSSGSAGNAALVRAGETHLLLDAGLPVDELYARFEAARVQPARLDHVALTHGHLDHARASGQLSKKTGATVHCCERLMRNGSLRGARRLAALTVGSDTRLEGRFGDDGLSLRPVLIPHDAEPTVAFRIEHTQPEERGGTRVAVLVTDMGRPDPHVARALAGAHVAILEFNHDPAMLSRGPYTAKLKRRVAGDRGHLSNAQAAEMLERMAGPELHTVVLAHLSLTNNTAELAEAAARQALERAGRTNVRVLVASQDEPGPNLAV